MTPSAAGAKHNITVGAGEKDPIGTLLVLGGVSAVLVGGGQALGSAALAAAAYLPVLAINYYGMKPRTREQLLSVLILWLSWSVFGALVAVVLSLGFLHWGWGSLLPCLVILTVMVRSKPEVPDFAFQRWVVPLFWDPPILAALAICDWFDLTLLHDGHGHYLSVVDDNICIASLPSVFRVPELEAANVGSVINMCYEASGPTAAYQQRGIVQLRLPTVDTTSPSVANLQTGVDFIREQLARRPGQRVLIHCKGGRGRAATMAAAWYVSTGLSVQDAVALLASKRSTTETVVATYDALQEFAAKQAPSTGPAAH